MPNVRRPIAVLLLMSIIVALAGAQAPGTGSASPTKEATDKAVRALILDLGDESFEKREAAEKRLTAIGEPAHELLKKAAIDNPDFEVRQRAGAVIQAIAASFFVEVRRFETPVGDYLPWCTRLVVTPDGKRVIATGSGWLRCWELETGKEDVKFDFSHKRFSWALALSADGRRLVVGSSDRVTRLFDTTSGKVLQEFNGHTADIWAVGLLPDGKRIATGGEDRTLRLWDVDTGNQLRSFENVQDTVRCLSISPDGKRIAAGHCIGNSGQGTLRVWDVETAKESMSFPGFASAITSVHFAPDGNLVLTSSFDRTVRLWDLAQAKEVKRFAGDTEKIECAAFAPGGKRIFSCGNGPATSVHVWDVASGALLFRSKEIADGFDNIASLPDGRHCVTAGRDGVVRLWQLKR